MPDGDNTDRPDLDRLRQQVMSGPEADAAVAYIEQLEAKVADLTADLRRANAHAADQTRKLGHTLGNRW